MTSAFEGFPMLIKEGMAYGCIPIVTALEGNKTHLTDNGNALLLNHVTNEGLVVEEAIFSIEKLLNNLTFWENISIISYEYAVEHFNKQKFIKLYQNLLIGQISYD